MIFKQSASAGTMDSCDISIRIEPGVDNQNSIQLSTVVEQQYGAHIRQLLSDVLKRYNVNGVRVNAVDRGALDCTIEARMVCAIHRACEMNVFENEVPQ